MKKLLILLTIVLGLFTMAPRASAQQFKILNWGSNGTTTADGSTPLNAGTNVCAAATTRTLNFPVKLDSYGDVDIQITFRCSGASTSNGVFIFSESADGTNYFPVLTNTIAHNGTNLVISQSHLTLNNIGYPALTSIQNTHASVVMTNLQVLYTLKPFRFGR
jgi:hypothetical protein